MASMAVLRGLLAGRAVGRVGVGRGGRLAGIGVEWVEKLGKRVGCGGVFVGGIVRLGRDVLVGGDR